LGENRYTELKRAAASRNPAASSNNHETTTWLLLGDGFFNEALLADAFQRSTGKPLNFSFHAEDTDPETGKSERPWFFADFVLSQAKRWTMLRRISVTCTSTSRMGTSSGTIRSCQATPSC